ncbi:MAG: hypothetical protein JWP22_2875, partial [Ramlibacter sp.]|nr:hypothetical protein [Ramlibacter sp.]
MDPSLTAALGPPPFRFTPSGGALHGAAYSLPFRVIATVIVGGAALWLVMLWLSGKMTATGS